MNITVKEVKEKMDQGESFTLIDVREQHEHDEFNIGGTLIPLSTLPHILDTLEDKKDSELVMYCRSGARSASAQQFLLQNGFTNVKNMTGGVLEWREKIGS